jgi:hypothetical protein
MMDMNLTSRVPDAVQLETVRRRAGTYSRFDWTSVLQRITACCAAPGERYRESAHP